MENDTFARFSNAFLLPDGKFRFTIDRADGESLTVSVPVEEAPHMIAFIAGIAKAANESRGLGPGTPPQVSELTPIETTGIGFAVAATNGETLLVVNMSGVALPFAMSSSGLLRLADDIERISRTLSAPTDRKGS